MWPMASSIILSVEDLKRLPEEDCEIRLELYVIFIKWFDACFVNMEKVPNACTIFQNGADIHLQRTLIHVQNNPHGQLMIQAIDFIGNVTSKCCEGFANWNAGINWMRNFMQSGKGRSGIMKRGFSRCTPFTLLCWKMIWKRFSFKFVFQADV